MSHALTIGLPRAPRLEARATARRMDAGWQASPSPFRVRVLNPRREPTWREAMRWALIGLTTSLAAGEVTLLLLGL
jgi:hypothetical protein